MKDSYTNNNNKMVIIYFETETDCDNFKETQNCKIMKLYDKLTRSYYLILSSNFDWMNRELKPKLRELDFNQEIYNNYCHIVKDIEKCTRFKEISIYEKERLPKLLKQFNKFRDTIRNNYDE